MSAALSASSDRPPRVGVVGAGQLARMLAEAAIPLGIELAVLAAQADDGAAQVARHVVIGAPDDFPILSAFTAGCDVLTFDHELVDARQLRDLERDGRVLRPSSETVAIAQDKARQRALWRKLGLPAPRGRAVNTGEEIIAFGDEGGWPIVVKAARGGYDGHGVWIAQNAAEPPALWLEAQDRGVRLLVEERVPIEREIAVVTARRPGGEIAVYPVVETVQRDGICHELIVPARIEPALATEAQRLAIAVSEATGAVGILAVEMFVVGEQVLINEIAARPHNSGHFSLGGCVTSQFENHLRAVLDLPLGLTDLLAPVAVTRNVLAAPETRDLFALLPAALAIPGARINLYGKQPRPGRKVGHVTVLGDDVDAARARAADAAAALGGVIWERQAVEQR
jgi:5-(carboxyamino)imidazole ribonucleotide synthase